MRTSTLLGLPLSLFLGSALCAAGDIRVPADHASIQAAIVAAADGDRVLVAPGIYHEELDFLGKAIEVRSESGSTTTEILGPSASAAVVRFVSGEGRDSVLRGFTIRDGEGEGAAGRARGGGVYCFGSSPTLQGNILKENTAFEGGGLAVIRGGVKVIGGSIALNVARGGGGIYLEDAHGSQFEGVRLRRNSARDGGGLFALDCTQVALVDCDLLDNAVADEDDLFATGGGAYFQNTQVLIDRCVFQNNAGNLGAGVFFAGRFGTRSGVVTSTLFAGNYGNRPDPNNWAAAVGLSYYNLTIVDSTLVKNRSNERPGIDAAYSLVTCEGCILWDNVAFDGGPTAVSAFHGTVSVDYCDVDGGQGAVSPEVLWGDHNIDLNPRFRSSSDYRLASDSPCLDLGRPLPLRNRRDRSGFPRTLDGRTNGIARTDMGAEEYSPIELAVTGSATPGGSLTIDLTGVPGLPALLWFGLDEGATYLPPYGTLFLDLSGAWGVLAWPSAPSTVDVALPASTPPTDLILQALAFSGSGTGAFSNDVALTIR